MLQVVGANTLRKYFCSIHPYWSNKPIDACNLDKGLLKLEKQQEQMFNSGNIKQWDVSLLIRVLRFSKRSSLELKKHPDIDKALKEVRDIRNNLIAHASSARLSKSNFEVQWNLLKANLIILGAKEEDVDGTLEGKSDKRLIFVEKYS